MQCRDVLQHIKKSSLSPRGISPPFVVAGTYTVLLHYVRTREGELHLDVSFGRSSFVFPREQLRRQLIVASLSDRLRSHRLVYGLERVCRTTDLVGWDPDVVFVEKLQQRILHEPTVVAAVQSKVILGFEDGEPATHRSGEWKEERKP